LSAFNREIVANGYMTQLGIFHDNQFNPFNLASDFMEPFRVLVDRKVVELDVKEFNHEVKMELVNILNGRVIIDGTLQFVDNAIRIYCKSLFDALQHDAASEIKFYQHEL